MAVARIRTSDPEVVEFLSRHLASSGYQLEFVRPGERAESDADLEIDASRMDLESAMAAARQEPGIITVLSGVLKADNRRDIFAEAAETPVSHDYAEVSPYARGAELQDEPSALHKTADAIVGALSAGASSVGEKSKSLSTRFNAWRVQRATEQQERQRQREREMEIEAARRRGEEMRRAEEEAKRKGEEERRRADEERVAAIRREEMTRMQAEEKRRREEQARVEAEAARVLLEEERRLQAEAAQRRAEVEARQREEELRRRAEQEQRRAEEERRLQEQARYQAEAKERRRAEVLTGIERQRQEELRLAEEARLREESVQQPQVEWQDEPVVEQVETADSGAASIGNTPEKEWQPVQVPPAGRDEFAPPLVEAPVASAKLYDRRLRARGMALTRERAFKRGAVAAAVVALGIISVWSLVAVRRPANPLTREQLVRSAIVEQQRPFGPASTAPVTRPPEPMRTLPARRPVTKKPTPRGRAARPHPTTSRTAKKSSSEEDEHDVVVRHFAVAKQETAKVKMKNGVKIISESD